jgi:hypothetical protein
MLLTERITPALKAAGTHLLASAAVALLSAALVFGLWYPPPYDALASGRQLILLVMMVDVVCGPFLTLIVFNPRKPRAALWRDMSIVLILQLAALGYGLFSVLQARPVWLAFEGDRFRVVSVPDVDERRLQEAPESLRHLSLTGPRLLGVRLMQSDDPALAQSIQLSMYGLHPAFRPGRWVPYEQQLQQVLAAAKPLGNLFEKHPDKRGLLDEAVRRSGLKAEQLSYLPLAAEGTTEWAVLIGREDAIPKAYVPLDTW